MLTKLRGAHHRLIQERQHASWTLRIGYIWLFWWGTYVYDVEDFTMSGDVTLTCRVEPWWFRRSYRNGNADGTLSSKSFVVLYPLQSYSIVRCTTMHTQRLTSSEAIPHVSSTPGGTGAKTRSTAPRVRRRRRVQLTSPLPPHTVPTWSAVWIYGESATRSPSPPSLPTLPFPFPGVQPRYWGIARPLPRSIHLLPRPLSTQPTMDVGTTGRSIQ